MAVKIISAKEAALMHGVKILAYGKAGTGKTTLAATAPNPILISAESGLLSIRKTNTDCIIIKTMADLEEAYQWCTESEEAKKYDTICLDSLSEIGEVVLSDAKARVNDPRQAYGELIDRMTILVKSFRDLDEKHVFISAKQELITDASGVNTFQPSMPGKQLGPALPYLFDEVFHADIGKDENGKPFYFLLTQADYQYEAKDRSGELLPMEYPDLTGIINKILGA